MNRWTHHWNISLLIIHRPAVQLHRKRRRRPDAGPELRREVEDEVPGGHSGRQHSRDGSWKRQNVRYIVLHTCSQEKRAVHLRRRAARRRGDQSLPRTSSTYLRINFL